MNQSPPPVYNPIPMAPKEYGLADALKQHCSDNRHDPIPNPWTNPHEYQLWMARNSNQYQQLYDRISKLEKRVDLIISSPWLPIYTAPKDGTAILAYYGTRTWALCKVISISWSGWGGGCWSCVSTGHNILSEEPTHWMPIPPDPE